MRGHLRTVANATPPTHHGFISKSSAAHWFPPRSIARRMLALYPQWRYNSVIETTVTLQ